MKAIDDVSDSTSHKNESADDTDNSTAVADNKIGSPKKTPSFDLLRYQRRNSPSKPNTTLDTERSEENDDDMANVTQHYHDYAADYDHDVVGASTLVSGISTPSLDGVSVATDSLMPFDHIVQSDENIETLNDDMSSINSSSVVGAANHDRNNKFKVTSYLKTKEDDGIYAPTLQDRYADTYSLVRPQPNPDTNELNSNYSATASSEALVYEMQEETISRSFLSKKNRSGRKSHGVGGIGRLTPFLSKRRESGTSHRNIVMNNTRNAGFVGAPMSPLSVSGVSINASEEESAINGRYYETGTEYNTKPANGSHDDFTNRRKSVGWSENTSDICSVDEGIYSVTDMQSQNGNQDDHRTDDDSIVSIGMQPINMYRVDSDVAAFREVGSLPYNTPPYDNPSTVVSSNDSASNNKSGEELTVPHKIPEVVPALADIDYDNSRMSKHRVKNSHQGSIEDYNDDYDDSKPMCCVPRWLQRSPLAMKLLIIGGLLVFLTAVVVAVSQYSLIRWNAMNASINTNATQIEQPSQPQGNKTSNFNDRSPTTSPSLSNMDSFNNTDFGNDDTVSQKDVPTSSPTTLATREYTMSPTDAYRRDTTVLYLLSGPYQYADNDTETISSSSSSSLSYVVDPMSLTRIPKNNGTSFMIHLGDWNSPTNTECSEQTYIDVANYYQNSSIPVYFVLGDNEYSECDNPTLAKTHWVKHLAGYETKHWTDPEWTVWRQGVQSSAFSNYYENFDFTNKQKLAFCGLSLSHSSSTKDMTDRDDANLAWVAASYQFYKNTVDAIIIFIHDTMLGSNAANRVFYTILVSRIRDEYTDMNFIIVHQSRGDTMNHILTKSFDGIPNLSSISVVDSTWPPAQITIKTGGGGAMPDVLLNQREWYYDLWGIPEPN